MSATTMSSSDALDGASPDPSMRLASAPIADEIEFLLARARTIGIIRANSGLRQFGLKVRHYVVLSLAASQLQPSQRELAEFLQLDPSQIVATIDLLESQGLVERAPSAEDRRVKVLNATAEGARVLGETKREVQQAEDDSLAALSLAERDQLRELLRRISFN
jgi:DNA-binding MarR family transcriptional regulator